MALFFDAAWYDDRLAERGLTRAVLAAAAGLTAADLALAFKDQRELSMREVAAFAELLGVSPAEAAARAGMRPPPPSDSQRIAALEARVAVLEAELARLKR
ncbi:helix-turn-helix domain-containing protein [Caulobacter sp. 1776]|uniref:helix-turn-helix domain-containing protein n=1 Tax=Caulobacter sp. 1776 TaxID=3156420 RepID=UPI00339B6835